MSVVRVSASDRRLLGALETRPRLVRDDVDGALAVPEGSSLFRVDDEETREALHVPSISGCSGGLGGTLLATTSAGNSSSETGESDTSPLSSAMPKKRNGLPRNELWENRTP